MISARHSGKAGDIIFSLPVVKALGIDTLMIPERTGEVEHLYSNVASLLQQQPGIKQVMEYTSDLPYLKLDPAIPVNYDLDKHRQHFDRGGLNIVQRYAQMFRVKVDETKPWLVARGLRLLNFDYDLIQVTERHRGVVNWRRLILNRPDKTVPLFFVGTTAEHEAFSQATGVRLTREGVQDLLGFALLIRDCRYFYGNQSVGIALAQGLGKKYFWERKTGKTNCTFKTEWQNEL
jgi:hypothetical protein